MIHGGGGLHADYPSAPSDLSPMFLHSKLSRRQIMQHIEEALDFL